jgi:hypothetical protein
MVIGVIAKNREWFERWCWMHPGLAPFATYIPVPDEYGGLEFSSIVHEEWPLGRLEKALGNSDPRPWIRVVPNETTENG